MNEPNEIEKTGYDHPLLADVIDGTWSGTIEFGDVPIPMVVRFDRRGNDLSALSDFPQHRRADIALRELSFDQGVLRFTTQSFGDYVGRLSADGKSMAGAFSKDEKRYPLNLRPGADNFAGHIRPQTPKPPFPYAIENVRVDNALAGCHLAGTLTVPAAGTLRACALLITGSGAMDRDETIFGHRPFHVLADYMSRHGYAVLRLDDRGVGESTGDRAAITMADETDDMSAAVDFLRRRRDLSGVPIGLVGHSMGGLIGTTLAARRADIAFLISMGSPGVALGEAFAERECNAMEKAGASKQAVVGHGEFTRALYGELGGRAVDDLIDSAQISVIAARYGATDSAIVKDRHEWVDRFNQPWFRSAARFEPAEMLARVTAPFLAINGSLDVQTLAGSNLDAIARVLGASSHCDFRTIELQGLNHLFQTCTTGAVYEYPAIEETFAPLALETIRAWLDERFETSGA